MPGPVFRTDGRVELRSIEPDDYGYLATNWNRQDIRRMTDGQEPWSHDGVASFVESDDVVGLLICRDGEPVGFCWLFHRDQVNRTAALGYWIAPDARGNGYATAAVELIAAYARDELDLRKLTARVFEGNGASEQVLENAGFKREGCLRAQYLVAGEYRDARLFGSLLGN